MTIVRATRPFRVISSIPNHSCRAPLPQQVTTHRLRGQDTGLSGGHYSAGRRHQPATPQSPSCAPHHCPQPSCPAREEGRDPLRPGPVGPAAQGFPDPGLQGAWPDHIYKVLRSLFPASWSKGNGEKTVPSTLSGMVVTTASCQAVIVRAEAAAHHAATGPQGPLKPGSVD